MNFHHSILLVSMLFNTKKISATAVCFLLYVIALSQKVQDVQYHHPGNLVIENVNIVPLTGNVVL